MSTRNIAGAITKGSGGDIDNNRELKVILKARERENKELKEALDNNSFTPALFLNNKSRDNFWSIVNQSDTENDRVLRMELQFRATQRDLEYEIKNMTTKYDDSILRIRELESKIAGTDVLKTENTKLKNALEKLNRKFEKEHAKQYYLQKQIDVYQEKVFYYENSFTHLEGFLRGSMNDYENENEKLKKRIKSLQPNMAKRGLNRIAHEMRATEIFYSKNSEYNIEQILQRLNSVNVDSDKFVEQLGLVSGFYRLVCEELDVLKEKISMTKDDKLEKDKAEKLISALTNKEFYTHYVKGLNSLDPKVFTQTMEFQLFIGNDVARQNAVSFEEMSVLGNLMNSLKEKDTYNGQKVKVSMLTPIIEGSLKCAKDFITLGGIQIIKDEIGKDFDPVFINSEYYSMLLGLLAKQLSHDIGSNDLNDRTFINTLMKFQRECHNKKSIYHLLSIIYSVSQFVVNRKIQCELGIFGDQIKFYEASIADRNLEIMFQLFMLYSRLTLENSFKVQLTSHIEITNDFSPFFEPFTSDSRATDQVKFASLEVVRNIILLGNSKEMRKNLVASGFIKMLIKKCLADSDSPLIPAALDCLLSITDLIKQGQMSMEDVIVTTTKGFMHYKDNDKAKFLLLLCWGVQYETFNVSTIDVLLVKDLITNSLIWLEEEKEELFERTICFIFLLFGKPQWLDTIMNAQFFEKYITAKASSTVSIKKKWLMGLTYITNLQAFQMMAVNNSQILKFLWNEINSQISMNTLETTKLISVCMGVKAMKRNIINEEFVAKFLVSVIDNFTMFEDYEDCAVLFSVLTRLSAETSGAVVMSKHREFIDFLKKALGSQSTIVAHSQQICLNLWTGVDEDSRAALFDAAYYKIFKAVCTFNKETMDPYVDDKFRQQYTIFVGAGVWKDCQVEDWLKEKISKAKDDRYYDVPYDPKKCFVEAHVINSLMEFVKVFTKS